MNVRLAEFQELIRIRENVHRSVVTLELCESCQRISECQQWNVEGTLVWRCGACASDLSPDLQMHTVNHVNHEGFSVGSHKQLWVRACPKCKGTLEKESPSDGWNCPRCGWR